MPVRTPGCGASGLRLRPPRRWTGRQVARREDFTGDLARLCAELRENPDGMVDLGQSLQELYSAGRVRRYLDDLMPEGEELLELLAAAEEECLAGLVGDEDEA